MLESRNKMTVADREGKVMKFERVTLQVKKDRRPKVREVEQARISRYKVQREKREQKTI